MMTLMIAMVISMMMMMTGQSALDLQKVCCGSWHSWLVSSVIFSAVFPSQCIYKILSCCIQLKAALHSADAVFPDTVFSVVCLSVYGRSDCGSTALHRSVCFCVSVCLTPPQCVSIYGRTISPHTSAETRLTALGRTFHHHHQHHHHHHQPHLHLYSLHLDPPGRCRLIKDSLDFKLLKASQLKTFYCIFVKPR